MLVSDRIVFTRTYKIQHIIHLVSYSWAGVKFYCKSCGCEGHRKHYCPELKDSPIDRRFRCRLCGERGHNRRSCSIWKSNESIRRVPRKHCCRICGQSGHNRRTCHQQSELATVTTSPSKGSASLEKRTYTCRLCLENGHNIRTCPTKNGQPACWTVILIVGRFFSLFYRKIIKDSHFLLEQYEII